MKKQQQAWNIAIGLKLAFLLFVIAVFFVPGFNEEVRYAALHMQGLVLSVCAVVILFVLLACVLAYQSRHEQEELVEVRCTECDTVIGYLHEWEEGARKKCAADWNY